MKTTEINEQVIVMSGEDEAGACVLSVLVKRTYTLDPTRGCVVAESQLPLVGLIADEDEPEIVVQESDVSAIKELTDIVVRGHVHPQRPTTRTSASVSVAGVTKEISVHGDRTCSRGRDGEVQFSPPAEFDKMPLSYRRAYGGVDQVALAKYGNPYEEYRRYAPEIAQRSRHHPYRYPRNGVGKGYLFEVSDAALEALSLPNLEDPSDPLTPARLAVQSPQAWPTMPLPWCTDWLSLGSFPRTAYYGGVPAFTMPAEELAEVTRGFMPKGVVRKGIRPEPCKLRICNAGSLGLQLGPYTAAYLPHLEFRLVNMHPTRRALSFHLPPGAPDIWVDARKGDKSLAQTTPVLHHVVIEPDHDRVSVVWRGSAPVIRRYTLDEMSAMPLLVTWPEDEKARS